jgi:uncharacterized protein
MNAVTQRSDAPLTPAIVVTGASSGIGREIARVAARDRMPLLLVARSHEALLDLAKQVEASGTEAGCLSLDLRASNAAGRIESALAEHGWYCDVLVLCAGIGVFGAFNEINRCEHLAVVDLNARVPTELALHFLPAMRKRRRGGLMFVGSIAAYAPGPNMAAYYASKAYLRSLSNALYAETKGSGVIVTNLSPGFVSTPFLTLSGIGATRLRKILPRMTAAEVAEAGWRGFKSGRRLIVPGLANRILIAGAKLLPTHFLIWLLRQLQRQPDHSASA